MTFKKCLFFLMVCFFAFNLKAQQTKIFSHSLVSFKKAEDLYKKKQYQTAQNLFGRIKKDTKDFEVESDCAYYIANCAVRLNQQNADVLMEDFVQNYPTSTKRNAAFLNVATYYFENANYAYAQKWFEKVDESRLSSNQLETYNFSKGLYLFTIFLLSYPKRH